MNTTTHPLTLSVLDQDGQPVCLQDKLGAPIVLYFYPKDDTPGCTLEACSFRDANTDLQKLGVQVIGVSADSVDSHNQFAKKYSLNFPLWSDPKRELLQAFGALAEKSLFGKIFLGVKRMSIALDAHGKVIHVWDSVNPETHTNEVLEFFKGL